MATKPSRNPRATRASSSIGIQGVTPTSARERRMLRPRTPNGFPALVTRKFGFGTLVPADQAISRNFVLHRGERALRTLVRSDGQEDANYCASLCRDCATLLTD